MNTNVYKQSSKCDNQKQLKDIPEADIVSTPELFTDNSPISTMTPTPINKPSAQKSLCLFTNILYVKIKLVPVKLEPPNLSARQLNLEINHGNRNKSEKGITKLMNI